MITRPNFKVFILLIGLALAVVSHAQERSIFSAQDSQASILQNQKQKQKILLINSNRSVERYQIAEAEFIDSVSDYQTHIVNLETEARPVEYLQDIINQNKFDLIYCIGAKALGSVDYIDPELPIVYSAVLNWRRFKGRDNYFGIASELSPQVQLTWFKYFFPDLKNIGVLYSHENQALIDDAKVASKNLGLNLKELKLKTDDQLTLSAKVLLKDDLEALWLISDSSTLSSVTGVADLFKLAEKNKVPVFTYDSLFMDLGAVMSLVADLPTTARQAALLTIKILENTRPSQQIQYPAGSRIILDGQKVNSYQMKLNPESLDSVDELR